MKGSITDDVIIDVIRNFYEIDQEVFIMKHNVNNNVIKEDNSYFAAAISSMIILKQTELIDSIIVKESEAQDMGVKTFIIIYIFNRIHIYKNNTFNNEIILFIEKDTNIRSLLFVNLLSEIIDEMN
jgi:hypothetical protein